MADGEILQRFTPPAIRVVQYAKEEARRFRGNPVGSEHLLLGLIREQEGVAARVLERLGVSPARAQNEITREMDAEEKHAPAETSRSWSSGARRVLELALEEARELNPKLGLPNFVDTEHLLLGLIREPDEFGPRVLRALGVDLDQVRREVLKLLGSAPSSVSRPPRTYVCTPLLDLFSRDLTRLAEQGQLDPVVAREEETRRIVRILSRRTRNRPLLIGEDGVGKTAIVEGLAQRISHREAAEFLAGQRLLALDATRLAVDLRAPGEGDSLLRGLAEELASARGELILFLDELPRLLETGPLSLLLGLVLNWGEPFCIGATTPARHRDWMDRDPALVARFQPVPVGEPSEEQTLEMLKALRPRYQSHHGVDIDDGALTAAVQLSSRLAGRFLPDRAIDVIEEAAAALRQDLVEPPELVRRLRRDLEAVQRELQKVVGISPLERDESDYQRGVELREERHRLREELNAAEEARRNERQAQRSRVTEDDIAQVIAARTGVPLDTLAEEGDT